MSKAHFFIHIGAHETGTTAIQQLLDEHYQALLVDGVLYPKSLRKVQSNNFFYSHHDLAWHLGFGNKKSRLSSPNNIKEILEEEIANKNPKKIVLSAEAFSVIPDNINPLKKLKTFIGDAECTFIYYVRRQDKYLESAYKQMAKNRTIGNFSKFAKRQKIFYDRIVQQFQSVFPNAHYIVEPFPESKKSNLLPGFLHELEIQNQQIINATKNYQKNESPSFELISHLQYLYKNTAKTEHALIKKFRLTLEKKEREKSNYTFLNDVLLKELESRYKASNEALSEMFPNADWAEFLSWPTSIDESKYFNINSLNKYDQNVVSFAFDLWKRNIEKRPQTKKGV